MAARTTESVVIGGRAITLSNAGKVLWPLDGYTKGDLVAYYRSVARWLIPHLQNRPLTLQRYPDGIDAQSFFEKQAPKYKPDWIPTVALAADANSRKVSYMMCNDEAALVWCANLAAIVLHVWYSHVPTTDTPDYALFDLDTCEKTTTKTLATVALAFREQLEAIGLPVLVKTSGGSGLHVVIPLKNKYDYDMVKQFAEIVAHRVNHLLPGETTLERAVSRRPKTAVYLDWVQVGRGKTVVPPYVARARSGAPVSMPLDWSEVEDMRRKRGTPEDVIGQWTIKTAPKRIAAQGDLWAARAWKPAALERALKTAQTAWAVKPG
ncbi:MAG: non-homologous end-joining DNA ligase [Candidatus Baltobacteraceae bacterium]